MHLGRAGDAHLSHPPASFAVWSPNPPVRSMPRHNKMNVGPTPSPSRGSLRAALARAGAAMLAAALVAMPQAARAQQEGGVIAGRVITQTGSRPIVGAQVAVQDQGGKGAVTDASGRFRITG